MPQSPSSGGTSSPDATIQPPVSAAFAAITGSVWLGLLAGILASIMLSLLHGLASITLRGDQIISGVAINFLAAGLTVVVAQDLFGQGGRTPPLKSGGRFEPINFPGATSSKEINDAGPLMQLYSELFSGHSLLVYVALLHVTISPACTHRRILCFAEP